MNVLNGFYGKFRDEFLISRNDRGLAALATTDLGHLITFDESTEEGRNTKQKFDKYREELEKNEKWQKTKELGHYKWMLICGVNILEVPDMRGLI